MRHLTLLILLGLAGCVGGPSPVSERGPGFVIAPVPGANGSRSDVLTGRLSPFTDNGQVRRLGIAFEVQNSTRSNLNGQDIGSSDTARAAAAEIVVGRPGANLDAMARSIARATYCPAGPITLNTERNRIDPDDIPRVAQANGGTFFGPNFDVPGDVRRRPISPIAMDDLLPGVANVLLRCDTPNPYMAAAAGSPVAVPAKLDSPDELRAFASGRTFVSYSSTHGVQVEYLSGDGRAALWYPGNAAVTFGQWTAEPNRRTGAAGVICYLYGNGSFNPATGVAGGRTCITGARFRAGQRDVLSGDPFALATGHVPFVLRNGRDYTLDELRRSAS